MLLPAAFPQGAKARIVLNQIAPANVAPLKTMSVEGPAGTATIDVSGIDAMKGKVIDADALRPEAEVAGQTPDSVTVRCGMRAIRIGSSGKTQRLEVPCGGDLTLSDR